MNMAGGMDSYVREVIGDDDITDYWNIYGVPDSCSEDMLEELLEVPGCFTNFCKAFAKCLEMDGFYEED